MGIASRRDVDGDDDYYMDKMHQILDENHNAALPLHPAKLLDHLYLGNQDNADDLDLLPALGITHVLNCAGTRTFDLTKHRYPAKLNIQGFLMIPAEDYDEFDIMQFFPEAITFLERAKAQGGKILVHCNLGVNRSGAIVAAYLMVSQRKPLLKVLAELQARRSLVLCNVGFRRQLLKYARARGLIESMEEEPRKNLTNGDKDKRETSYSFSESSRNGETATRRNGYVNGYADHESKTNGFDGRLLSTESFTTRSSTSRSTSRHLEDDVISDDDEEVTKARAVTAYRPRLSTSAASRNASTGGSSYVSSASSSYIASPVSSSYTAPSSYASYSDTASSMAGLSLTSPTTSLPSPASYTYHPEASSSRIRESASPRSSRAREVSPVATYRDTDLHVTEDYSCIDTPVTDSYVESSGRDRYTDNYSKNYTEQANGSGYTNSRDTASFSTADDYSSTISKLKAEALLDSGWPTSSSGYSSGVSNGSSLMNGSSLTNGSSYSGSSFSSSINGLSSSLLASDPPMSVHPLLAKPMKPYATCTTENFKTNIKPRSYYHRKVVGRVPKYSDVDEELFSPLDDVCRTQLGMDLGAPKSASMYEEEYTKPARRYSVSSSRPYSGYRHDGSNAGHRYESPVGFTSSHYNRSDSSSSYRNEPALARSTTSQYDYRPRDYSRASSLSRDRASLGKTSTFLSSSYRPMTSGRSAYSSDLEADIEAFNGACLSLPYEGSMSAAYRHVPSRAAGYSVPLFGW